MNPQSPQRGRAVVLVVDDDLNTRLLAQACLERSGFLTEEARNGEEALQAFAECLPDIVFLDVLMPKMDGISACRAIRKLPTGVGVPILMMTAVEDEASINQAYEAGATDFILKPISWHILPYRVKYLLRANRAMITLAKALEDLKTLDKAKDAFLSTVSHELRTPLTAIRSFAEILSKYDVDPEERKEFIRIIHTESERLSRLVDDVLDIARIEPGKMVLDDKVFSLEDLLAKVSKVHEPLLLEKSLRLRIEIAQSLLPVRADQDRIHQVLTNLLGNAVKFSPEGREIRIRVERFHGQRSGEPPEWIKVAVSDQGIGIDHKDFVTIFDKFKQVVSDTLGEKPRGTGLGLPICKEIITHYGGNIWVESERGSGSTFFFTLPAARQETSARESRVTLEGDVREEPVPFDNGMHSAAVVSGT